MPMEGAGCIGTNLDDKQTPLTAIKCVLHRNSGLNNLFWGLKYRKIGVEKHPFCILFQVPPTCGVFDSHGLCWARLW